jgi:hypothetical protein
VALLGWVIGSTQHLKIHGFTPPWVEVSYSRTLTLEVHKDLCMDTFPPRWLAMNFMLWQVLISCNICIVKCYSWNYVEEGLYLEYLILFWYICCLVFVDCRDWYKHPRSWGANFGKWSTCIGYKKPCERSIFPKVTCKRHYYVIN